MSDINNSSPHDRVGTGPSQDVDPFDIASLDDPETGAAPTQIPPYLRGLNEGQRLAVDAMDGPVLVLAGAGTGKTRVLTTRLAHILHNRRAFPSQILAVTFTNKAAREMQNRVAGMVGRAVEGLWMGTFHAIGVRIIRRHAELVGLKSNFTILDTDDQLRLWKQVMEAADIDIKRWPPRLVAGIVDRWKDRGLTPDKIGPAEAESLAFGKGADLYGAYQKRLMELNATDFGDLLLHCLTLFAKDAAVLTSFQQQFRYVLVDEYQDTNVAQYLLLRLIAQGHGNICCVGDDDQSIYSWRGAEVGNILRFEKDFPGATVIRLEQNYRSTPHILGAASGLISKNQDRHGKTLWTDLSEGERLVVRGVWDGEEEARVLGDEVEALHRNEHMLREMAVLVRAGFQTREFEERFIQLAIPYRLIGGTKFYERAHIRDAMAYCRVLMQPDDDLAFERIVNKPKRTIGAKSVQTVHQVARAKGYSMVRASELICETSEIPTRARNSLRELLQAFARWRTLLSDGSTTVSHAELVEIILDESGYTTALQLDKSPQAPGRLEDLKEFVRAVAGFETLADFLEHVALVMDVEAAAGEDAINVITLHGAKGLEFDTVFLPGWEEGLFPHQRALDEAGNDGLEEERRLAYVGITRARKRAVITYAANRRMFDRWVSALPSRFVSELPDEHIDKRAETGLSMGDDSYLESPGAFTYGSGMGRTAAPKENFTSPVTNSPDAISRGIGDRIFHQKFGYGHIAAIEGNKLEIVFEKAGRKKVIDSFVEPA